MGLFDFMKKPKPNKAVEDATVKMLDPDNLSFHFPKSEDEETMQWSFFVNISEKQMRPLDDDMFYNVQLKKNGDKITATKGNETIFEVDKRSKAYKEIEPYTGHKAHFITIKQKEGQYGTFYRVRLVFRVVVD